MYILNLIGCKNLEEREFDIIKSEVRNGNGNEEVALVIWVKAGMLLSLSLSLVMNCNESDLLLCCERNPRAKAKFFGKKACSLALSLSFLHMGWWVLCLFIFFSQICYDVIIKVYKFCGRWIWIYDRHGWCQIVGFGSKKWNWLKMRVVCFEVWKKINVIYPICFDIKIHKWWSYSKEVF